MGDWSVFIPPATDQTNLVTNPSFELSASNYTGITNTVSRSSAYQRRGTWSGSYSMAVGASDGLYYSSVSLTAGSTYTFSCDLRGASGVPYKVYFAASTGTAVGTAASMAGNGGWVRPSVTYTAGSTGTYRLYVTKNSDTSTSAVYVDGFQCVSASYDQDYFDGDSRGFRDGDYYWTGTPHGSTSVMLAGTRAGGQAVDMENYGFYVRQIIGLGLVGISNILINTPLIGGAQYQRTVNVPSVFAMTGYIKGAGSHQDLSRNRRSLVNAFKLEAANTQQPVLLKYQETTGGSPLGLSLRVPAVYEGGLEGGESVAYTETAALKFTNYLPYVAYEDGTEGASPGYQTTVASNNYIIQRTKDGAWSNMGTGASGNSVRSIAVGPDGTVYAGGDFTKMGGAASTVGIAKWNGSAWSSMGTGANDDVYALAVGPDGTVYAGGLFTAMGGAASTAYIAKWNGSAWSNLGAGGTGGNDVSVLAIGSDGTVYAGGNFTSMGGAASTAYIAKWNGSAWSSMGSGADSAVQSLAVGPDGTVYAGGAFTSMGGAASTAYIAKWNGSAWSSMGSGANSNVYALAVGPDGTVYAGGAFTSIGGASSTAYIAKWNGLYWTSMGSGGSGGNVRSVSVGPDGTVYAGGNFTSMGGAANTSYIAQWNGSAWTPFISKLPGSVTVYDITYDKNKNIYFGYDTTGTATVETVTTLTNTGTANAYPVIKIIGPGVVYAVKNYTTGETIYFNLTLNASETAILDLTPGAIRFYSNFRANLLNTVLPGSNLATFHLAPGANNFSLFIYGSTDANTAASVYWRKVYSAIDGGAN